MKKGKPVYMLFSIFDIIIFFIPFSGCGTTTESNIRIPDEISISAVGYDLNNPDEIFILPPVLHEISGIALVDSCSVACVQDEVGMIFIYDLMKRSVFKDVTFYGNGDYEGITVANDVFFILKSNGTLYKISDTEKPYPPEEIRLKGIPHREYEGLCYDSNNNRLLIAPKDKAEKDSKTGSRQGIYEYNLETGETVKDPVIEFKLSIIKDFAIENNVFGPVEYNRKGESKKPEVQFRPSAIALHPVTGCLYLLSATDYMLFVFSLKGEIKYMVRLRPELFKQSEGITFFENGDMLISNEGQAGNATMLRFNYRR